MIRLLSAIKKEALILFRDKAGLAVLFAMPMALVFIMTILQDSAFKSLNETGIPIIFVDEDKDTLGFYLEKGLANSGFFTVSKSINGKPADKTDAQKTVAEGKYMIGIIIPKGATKAIRTNVRDLVAATLSDPNEKTKVPAPVNDSIQITIMVDPVTPKSYVTSVTSSLREFISKIKSQIIFKTFTDELAELMPVNTNAKFNDTEIISYKEIYATKSKDSDHLKPNAVQHNVPAWSVFSMFFIVIPLAGSMIMERGEGSAFRLKTIPGALQILLGAKVTVYMTVCMVQLVLMLMVGTVILPLLGLPVLQFGTSPTATVLVGMSTAFAATCYGLMFGSIATTHQQGAIGGSVSVLIMAAIGGVWVPVHLMPDFMKSLSRISPLNWALEAFHDLFLRGGGIVSVLPEIGLLIGFSLCTMAISFWYSKRKNNI